MGTDDPGLTLVTAPPPTPNGPLHVGHLSGPYLAADIAARAARARGERVLTLCGLDVHQNYVLTKAQAEGRAVGEVLDGYGKVIRAALDRARIAYDVFLDPTHDRDYRQAVAGLLAELLGRGAAVLEETTLLLCELCGRNLHHGYVSGSCPGCGLPSGGGTCEGCGGFTTAHTLRDARCTCCGGAPRPERVAIPLLRLEDHRDQLLAVWTTADLPPRVRALLARHLAGGLPDVPLAYPTDWGIPFGDGQRIDVWAEMGLGYLYAVARALEPSARSVAECVAAWRGVAGVWHFLGIDNAFYYAVLFPALLAAAGLPNGTLSGLVVNEFYRLDGQKFSTSRNHAVWAGEFLAGEDPGLVRLYLSWDRPDTYGSDFTYAGYGAFRDRVKALLDGPGTTPPALARLECTRAAQALRFAGFDPPLAARCLLAALPAEPDADSLLALLTGGAPR